MGHDEQVIVGGGLVREEGMPGRSFALAILRILASSAWLSFKCHSWNVREVGSGGGFGVGSYSSRRGLGALCLERLCTGGVCLYTDVLFWGVDGLGVDLRLGLEVMGIVRGAWQCAYEGGAWWGLDIVALRE